jgi:hypothetical protein
LISRLLSLKLTRHHIADAGTHALYHPRDKWLSNTLRARSDSYSGFAPVSSFRIRVEQAKIRDDMLLIISGQHGIGGRGIGDIARSGEVRFTLKNGRRLPGLSGPKSATTGLGTI